MPSFTLVESCYSEYLVGGAGQINSGSNNFSDTVYGVPTSSAFGTNVCIVGAGAGGANLDTTILTYTSGTALALNANAGTNVTGAPWAFSLNAIDIPAANKIKVTITSALQIGDIVGIKLLLDPSKTATITDSLGNTYATGTAAQTNGDYWGRAFYFIQTAASAAGTYSYTITLSANPTGTTAYAAVHAILRPPVGYTAPTFVQGNAGNGNSASVGTGNVTTTAALTGALSFTGVNSHVVAPEPAGWTTSANDQSGDQFGYITETGNQTFGATYTQSSAGIFLAFIMAFGVSPASSSNALFYGNE